MSGPSGRLAGDLPEVQLFAGELFFNDTSCLDSRSQHVLLSGEIVRLADSVHFAEVAVGFKVDGTAFRLQTQQEIQFLYSMMQPFT